MQHKLVVADLGAAGNLVKNLIMLSPEIHWPFQKDRYQTILNQYSTTVNFDNWLSIEYQLCNAFETREKPICNHVVIEV